MAFDIYNLIQSKEVREYLREHRKFKVLEQEIIIRNIGIDDKWFERQGFSEDCVRDICDHFYCPLPFEHGCRIKFKTPDMLEPVYGVLDFICERTNYNRRYFQDRNTYVITGHTPTMYINRDASSKVYTGNGHIAIDCGCVYGGKLAAYCIEEDTVIYVDAKKVE